MMMLIHWLIILIYPLNHVTCISSPTKSYDLFPAIEDDTKEIRNYDSHKNLQNGNELKKVEKFLRQLDSNDRMKNGTSDHINSSYRPDFLFDNYKNNNDETYMSMIPFFVPNYDKDVPKKHNISSETISNALNVNSIISNNISQQYMSNNELNSNKYTNISKNNYTVKPKEDMNQKNYNSINFDPNKIKFKNPIFDDNNLSIFNNNEDKIYNEIKKNIKFLVNNTPPVYEDGVQFQMPVYTYNHTTKIGVTFPEKPTLIYPSINEENNKKMLNSFPDRNKSGSRLLTNENLTNEDFPVSSYNRTSFNIFDDKNGDIDNRESFISVASQKVNDAFEKLSVSFKNLRYTLDPENMNSNQTLMKSNRIVKLTENQTKLPNDEFGKIYRLSKNKYSLNFANKKLLGTTSFDKRVDKLYKILMDKLGTSCKPDKDCCFVELELNVKDLELEEIIVSPLVIPVSLCIGSCSNPTPDFDIGSYILSQIKGILVGKNLDSTRELCCMPRDFRRFNVAFLDIRKNLDFTVLDIPTGGCHCI